MSALLAAPLLIGVASSYKFTLSAAWRAAGITRLGRDAAHTRFFSKLNRGEPVLVAVLGASVAQNGGCFAQPGLRCMLRNGQSSDYLVWGEPRSRPFKGFLVRWFEWLNMTWPHHQHKLINRARDASSLSTLTPCLHSHLPQGVDLVLIEAGSMFLSNQPAEMEHLTRLMLAQELPPAITFVTVHAWCTFGGSERKKTLGFGLSSLASCLRGPLDPHGRRCVYSHIRQHQFPWGRPAALRSTPETVPENMSENMSANMSANMSETTGTGAGSPSGTSHRNETRPLWSASGVYAWRRQQALVSHSDMLEDGIVDVCTRYGISCLSTRDALSVGLRTSAHPHPPPTPN